MPPPASPSPLSDYDDDIDTLRFHTAHSVTSNSVARSQSIHRQPSVGHSDSHHQNQNQDSLRQHHRTPFSHRLPSLITSPGQFSSPLPSHHHHHPSHRHPASHSDPYPHSPPSATALTTITAHHHPGYHPALLSQPSAWAFSRPEPAHHHPRRSQSRTHIPSLTAHGFKRPLDPQSLQAQRRVPCVSSSGSASTADRISTAPTSSHESYPTYDRHSIVSASTNHHDDDASTARPSELAHTFQNTALSWGSDTGPSLSTADRHGVTLSPHELSRIYHQQQQQQQQQQFAPYPHDQLQIPIQMRQYIAQPHHTYAQRLSSYSDLQPVQSATGSHLQSDLPELPELPDRPCSRSSHFLGFRPSSRSKGHSRLASNITDVSGVVNDLDPEKQTHEQNKNENDRDHRHAQPYLGRNYEYAVGNNVFCGKGRFLNSRDKPVNILTGIMILLPCGLFFGYS
ncbi:Eukaryotic peptide chain release factor GTP-binding subunit, partial [Ascosphaera aggregata]